MSNGLTQTWERRGRGQLVLRVGARYAVLNTGPIPDGGPVYRGTADSGMVASRVRWTLDVDGQRADGPERSEAASGWWRRCDAKRAAEVMLSVSTQCAD